MTSRAVLDFSRWQFAFTAAFHITLPAITVGLALFLFAVYAIYMRTRDPGLPVDLPVLEEDLRCRVRVRRGRGDRADQFQPEDWLTVIFNPSFPDRMLHMLIAAGWLIAGISAYYDVTNHRDSIAFAHLLWTGRIPWPLGTSGEPVSF